MHETMTPFMSADGTQTHIEIVDTGVPLCKIAGSSEWYFTSKMSVECVSLRYSLYVRGLM